VRRLLAAAVSVPIAILGDNDSNRYQPRRGRSNAPENVPQIASEGCYLGCEGKTPAMGMVPCF
jgi:hypothetical protein